MQVSRGSGGAASRVPGLAQVTHRPRSAWRVTQSSEESPNKKLSCHKAGRARPLRDSLDVVMAAYPVSDNGNRITRPRRKRKKKIRKKKKKDSKTVPPLLWLSDLEGSAWVRWDPLAAPVTLRGLSGCPQPPVPCVCWDVPALLYTVLLLKLLPSLILNLLTSGPRRTNQLRAVPVAIEPPHHNPARAPRAIYATHSRRQLSRICLQTVACW